MNVSSGLCMQIGIAIIGDDKAKSVVVEDSTFVLEVLFTSIEAPSQVLIWTPIHMDDPRMEPMHIQCA